MASWQVKDFLGNLFNFSVGAGQAGGESEQIVQVEGVGSNNVTPVGTKPVAMGMVDTGNVLRWLTGLIDGTIFTSPRHGKTLLQPAVNVTTAVGTVTWLPAIGQHLKVRSLFISTNVAQTITFVNAVDGAALFGPIYMVANEGFSLDPGANRDDYWFQAATNSGISILSTAIGHLGGGVTYLDEA